MQPLDLLCKMCPLAFVEILTLSLLSGELSSIWSRWDEITQVTHGVCTVVRTCIYTLTLRPRHA